MILLTPNKATKLEFQDNSIFLLICGQHNKNLSSIEKHLNVSIDSFGNQIKIKGIEEDVKITAKLIKKLYERLKNKKDNLNEINSSYIDLLISEIEHDSNQSIDKDKKLPFAKTWKKSIYPKNSGQEKYCKALLKNEMVFGLGPAGTGKSYLAVAVAIDLLKKNLIDKIILSRPAVEAGERLGFLPGDMKDKVDPYLRPLYDALYEMIPSDKVDRMIINGKIEIAPVAFMRGRTLSNAFVIIDEAQNTTPIQMKMVLTRLGENSRMVITGDLSQIDLPAGQHSGLSDAVQKLKNIDGIEMVSLSSKDIVRHPLLKKILSAYES